MSEANTVYDLNGHIVATAKFGVVWLREPRTPLGLYEYGENGQIQSRDGNIVGTFSEDGLVLRADGTLAGRIVADERGARHLLVREAKVGKCIGCPGACSAALLFLFADRKQSICESVIDRPDKNRLA